MSHRMLMLSLWGMLLLASPAWAQTPAAPQVIPGTVPTVPTAPASIIMEDSRPLANFTGAWNPPPAQGAFWARGEYVQSWFQPTSLPPVLSTSVPGTPQALAGVQGQTTTGFLANQDFGGQGPPGFQFAAGYWFGRTATRASRSASACRAPE